MINKKRSKDTSFYNGIIANGGYKVNKDTKKKKKKTDHTFSKSTSDKTILSPLNRFIPSGILDWIAKLKEDIMKVIHNITGSKKNLSSKNISSLIKRTALSSLCYGVAFISYVSIIYFISCSLSDSNEILQVSWRKILYAFIVSIIILSSLIYLFRLLIWHYKSSRLEE